MFIIILLWNIVFCLLVILFAVKTKNLFHPLTFFTVVQLLQYGLPLFSQDHEFYVDFDINHVLQLIGMESLFIFFVFLGYFWKSGVKFVFRANKENGNIQYKYDMNKSQVSYILVFITFLIGFLSRVYLFSKLGGISYILGNSHAVYSSMVTGYGAVSILARLMLVSIVCMFERVLVDNKFIDKVALLIMIIIYMGSYLIYSSRGPALELILVLFCCYSMNYRSISLKEIFNPKYIIAIIIMAVIAIYALAKRINVNMSGQSFSYYINILVSEFNRSDRDIFTYSYFADHAKWFGKEFLSVLVMFVPSSVWPNKPVVDDGFLLCNLMYGNTVTPTMGRLNLDLTIGSVPFTTQGLAYANFGILGVIGAGFLMGAIYRVAYDRVYYSNNTMSTLVYFYVIYMLGFTPLYIQNFISILIFAFIFQKVFHIRVAMYRR